MSDSLIEQVRKCAEAQKKADLSAGKAAYDLTEADAAALDKYWEELVKLELPALLAHIATQAEALKVAVDALKKQTDFMMRHGGGSSIERMLAHEGNAALSRIAALTGETK